MQEIFKRFVSLVGERNVEFLHTKTSVVVYPPSHMERNRGCSYRLLLLESPTLVPISSGREPGLPLSNCQASVVATLIYHIHYRSSLGTHAPSQEFRTLLTTRIAAVRRVNTGNLRFISLYKEGAAANLCTRRLPKPSSHSCFLLAEQDPMKTERNPFFKQIPLPLCLELRLEHLCEAFSSLSSSV